MNSFLILVCGMGEKKILVVRKSASSTTTGWSKNDRYFTILAEVSGYAIILRNYWKMRLIRVPCNFLRLPRHAPVKVAFFFLRNRVKK